MADEHWHSCGELLYVFGGEAEQTVGDMKFTFRAGDTLLIPSGALHATRALTEDCYISVTLFDCTDTPDGCILTLDEENDMKRIFSRMQEESALRETGWQIIAKGLLLEALGLLERRGKPLERQNQPSGEGQRIEDYLRRNLTNGITLVGAAEYAGYTPAYFSRHFSALMGMSFKSYVDRMKIRAARGMLADGASVSETAAALCYDTPSSFCRAFKRVTGVTPSEFQSGQDNRE